MDEFRPSSEFRIKSRSIGSKKKCYIIAELSANHNQDLELAKKTVLAAKEIGADAIKLQTYRPETITLDSDLPHFQTRPDSLWKGQKLFELYKKAYTPWEWHPILMDLAASVGIDCFSSPFDASAVDFLDSLDVPAYKIASLEITDTPLISYTAAKGKPIIISTGAASREDIDLAVQTCLEAGNRDIALLKCTAAYPTPLEEVNLRSISLLAEQFGTVVGLSDHTLGPLVPSLAVAMGASIIEKHLILDDQVGGVDSAFSLTTQQFGEMVSQVRLAETALGEATFEPTDKMRRAMVSRRSLFAVVDIRPDEVLSPENIKSLRPGNGMHPKHMSSLLGKKAAQYIEKGTPLRDDLIVDL